VCVVTVIAGILCIVDILLGSDVGGDLTTRYEYRDHCILITSGLVSLFVCFDFMLIATGKGKVFCLQAVTFTHFGRCTHIETFIKHPFIVEYACAFGYSNVKTKGSLLFAHPTTK
jgi:hypothetical protein